jgi:hypothetical protein
MGFKGFIMSDRNAAYSVDYAMKGLDMQSGARRGKLRAAEDHVPTIPGIRPHVIRESSESFCRPARAE